MSGDEVQALLPQSELHDLIVAETKRWRPVLDQLGLIGK